MKTLKVHSAYNTLSGEVGSEAIMQGSPVTVLRLYGCNLSCPYCDARDAVDGGTFQEMTTRETLKLLAPLREKTGKLLITGGEPLLQQEGLEELIDNVSSSSIIVETNGSISPQPFWDGYMAYFVVDIKRFGSELCFNPCWFNQTVSKRVSFFKFVVQNEEDIKWVFSFVEGLGDIRYDFRFAASPAMDVNNLEASFVLTNMLAKKLIEHAHLDIHLNLQLHKLCNVE